LLKTLSSVRGTGIPGFDTDLALTAWPALRARFSSLLHCRGFLPRTCPSVPGGIRTGEADSDRRETQGT
jgi:hypothetical protein